MIRELTLEEAKQSPATFMYVWANINFLRAIPRKYAEIIGIKGTNQLLLMQRSAEKAGVTLEYYKDQVREAFVDMYGMKPIEALVELAKGNTVAGKNWAKGVYGIGATLVSTFAGQDGITVRAEDGHILKNGVDITDITKTVYSKVGGNVIPFQYFGVDEGVTYQSQYYRKQGKYYAQTFSNENGLFKAYNGSATTGSDAADIWGTVTMWVERILEWILSFFNISTSPDQNKVITEKDLVPNQQQDGFMQGENKLEASSILLILAAGGALVASGALKGKKTKTVK